MNLQMQRRLLASDLSSEPATTTRSRYAAIFCEGVNNGEAITLKAFEWRQPKTVNFPGGVSRELTYDGLQRLQSYIVKDPAKNPIMSATYNIDTVGNILNQQTEHGVYQYNHDELDRLITVDNHKILGVNMIRKSEMLVFVLRQVLKTIVTNAVDKNDS